jgi:large conductance mechanosensitive channel protein
MATRKRNTKNSAQNTTRIVTNGPVRIEQPKSTRQQKPDLIEIVQDVNPASGFINFLREQAVVGLAVGFIIGTQAQSLVKQLVASFIEPLFTLFFGQEITERGFTITFHGRSAEFMWGSFIYGLINFLFVLLAIYVVIKFFKLDKLDKPKK